MDGKVHDEPCSVDAEDGKVVVEAPDGNALSLTPEAAAETSDRLLLGAARANCQRLTRARKKT